MIVVNKIDADNVDLAGAARAASRTRFGKECLPINLPAHGGKDVVDCFFNPDGESDFSSVKAAHSALVDQVVEVDEDLMALYLEQGEELQPEQLHAPVREGAARRPPDSGVLHLGAAPAPASRSSSTSSRSSRPTRPRATRRRS